MRRGTTPTILVKINGIDPQEISCVYFSIKQGIKTMTFDSTDCNKGIFCFPLTQEQTLSFHEGSVQCQAKIRMKDGTVIATPVKIVAMSEILHEGVI